MVPEEDEISERFGSVRLVGGESLVSHRTVFSRDSKILFCSCGRKIRVYSTLTGDLLRELQGHEGKVTDFKINPKNHLQLISCAVSGDVIYWDYTDGQIIKKYRFEGSLVGLMVHSVHNESVFLIKQTSCKGKKRKSKEEKKKKLVEPEEYSLSVYNPRYCKKVDKPKLKVILHTSGNSKQTTMSGDGNLLATVKENNLHLWNFLSGKLNTFSYRRIQFSCAAFHPLEACVATGVCGSGEIILWQGLDQLESPATSVLHWHPNPVSDIIFSHDGSNMFSGGEEGVLVLWQYKTDHQVFLPRLSTPINHLAISPDDSLTAVSQRENVIRLVNNTEWKIKRTIQGLRQIDNLFAGIVYDPRSKGLVTSNKPGVLQFYLPQSDHHAFSLDVVRQNIIVRTKKEQVVCTKVDQMAFNDSGSWLATVERRDDKKNAMELRLKFWEYNQSDQCYVTNTCVDSPHDKKIVAIQFQPQQKRDESTPPLAMTAGKDGKFKIWLLAEETAIKGKEYSWSCQSVGYYGDKPCQDAAFSQDGSLLAVAYDKVITLWTPSTNELRKTLALPYPDEEIKRIKFGHNSSSQYLVSITNRYLTVWNLLSCTVWWSVEAPVTCLLPDPQTNLICVFVSFNKNKSHLYIFDPASPHPVAVQSSVSRRSDVVSAVFDRESVLCSNKNGKSFKMSKLYFLNQEQKLFTLDFGESEDKKSPVKSQESAAKPEEQTEFYKIFGQSTKSRAESTSDHRVGKGVRGNPSSAVVRQMLQTPSHVLPSVSSICSSFLQSLLVSKQSAPREDQDNDKNSDDENEVESMDEDEDSDVETTRVTEGASGQVHDSSMETTDSAVLQSRQLNSGEHYADLDSVNFTWLKDFFASS
ncbi:WD repeat-containing protein 75 [Pocillopora verrucosa]|uniref:WD repeat-containing protein 75 n=1 Tax=Pocillopora verrucosa TaxID=203993 RepID=UPI00333EDA9B